MDFKLMSRWRKLDDEALGKKNDQEADPNKDLFENFDRVEAFNA